MIAGLPLASWILLLGSVLVPLAIVLRFHRVHSRPPGPAPGGHPTPEPPRRPGGREPPPPLDRGP